MSSLPWAKIWWDWFASRSHVDLSGYALALGAPLMLICREAMSRDDERHSDGHSDGHDNVTPTVTRTVKGRVTKDVVWAVHTSGKPVTATSLATIVRFDPDLVQKALDELVACQTLVLSDDGVYGFPKFRRYQESPSAARTRKHRAKKKRHSDASCDATGNGDGDACGDGGVTLRGQRLDLRVKFPPYPPTGGGEGLPQVAPANNQTEPSRSPPTGVHMLEVDEAFRQAYEEANAGTMPTLTRNERLAAVEHCRNVASAHGVSLREAALRVAKGALPGSEHWVINVRRVDPFAVAKPLPGRPGRLERAPATTGKDFADAAPIEDQLEKLRS